VIDGKNLKMKIKVKKDEVDTTRTVQGNPYIIKKQTESTLIVQDGETIVISGLTKQTILGSNSGIPGLKDIPGLGGSSRRTVSQRRSRKSSCSSHRTSSRCRLRVRLRRRRCRRDNPPCRKNRLNNPPCRKIRFVPVRFPENKGMSYYKLLELNSEPFSNSPEPDLFYQAPQYVQCLQKLEISIRLRRGLNVVMGDVGTARPPFRGCSSGSSAAREMSRCISCSIPTSTAPSSFSPPSPGCSGSTLGGGIERVAAQGKHQGLSFPSRIHKDRVIVLIIDEGQRLPPFCIELLREFLNYETNTSKLLQIVLFAQKEFKKSSMNTPISPTA